MFIKKSPLKSCCLECFLIRLIHDPSGIVSGMSMFHYLLLSPTTPSLRFDVVSSQTQSCRLCKTHDLGAVLNAVSVGVALLGRAGSRSGGGGSGAGSSGSRRRSIVVVVLLLELAGASDTGGSDIVGPDVNGEVLQRVAVDDGVGGVVLCELEGLGVVLGVVLDGALGDEGHVEDAVEEVGGPEGVELGVGDVVAQAADGSQGAADLKGERADDGLLGGVGAAPVARPAGLGCAVAVRVVAAEGHAVLVGVDDAVVPADGGGGGRVAKVLADVLGAVAEAEDVVAGVGGELLGLGEADLELGAEGRVARLVDGEGLLPAGGPVVGGLRGGGRGRGDGDGLGGGGLAAREGSRVREGGE